MAIPLVLSGKRVTKGHQCGNYRAHLDTCLDALSEGDIVLGRLFDICGFGWRLGMTRTSEKRFRAETKCLKLEAAELRLFSCNPQPVYADIEFLVDIPSTAEDSVSEGCSRVALPFSCMCKRPIILNRPLHLMNKLDATVRFKNMSFVEHDEQGEHGIGLRNISLEIIDKFSIDKHLNMNRMFGIVSAAGQRKRRVYSGSLVRLWSERNPDRRYLLCQRCGDGRVIVKRCLNDAPMSESFGDIPIGNEWPSITIFEQTKRDDEHFQTVDSGTLFLFIKVYEPDVRKDLTYLEFLQAHKKMPVEKLLDKICYDVDFPVGSEYNVYMEEAEHSIKEITFETTSLEEIGLHSGSNIIIRKKRPNEEVKVEDVLLDLQERYVEQPDRHEPAQCEIVKQGDSFEFPASIETLSSDADDPSSGYQQPKISMTLGNGI